MAEFRVYPLLVDGVNVAEINAYTADYADNGERQLGAGVVLGVSEGVPTEDLKVTQASPVAGHSVDMMKLARERKVVGVGYQYNGGFYIAPYRIMKGSLKNESKTGVQTGDWEMMNAGPAEKVA